MNKITIGLCAIIGTYSGFSTAAPIYITEDNKLNLNGTIYSGYKKASEYKKNDDISEQHLDSYFRLGFQGASKISDSLISIGEFEVEMDISDTFENEDLDIRLGYVGLMSENYGTLTYGKQYSTSRLLTTWTDTGVSRMSANDAVTERLRQSNILKYNIEPLNGLVVGIDRQFEYSNDFYDRVKGGNYGLVYELTSHLSAGALYSHQKAKLSTGEQSDTNTYMLGAQYQYDAFSAAVVIDKTNEKSGLGDYKAIETSISYDIANYRFVTRFMKRNSDLDTQDVETITFGVNYKLNKHLDILSEFNSSIQNHDFNQFTIAAKYRF